mgnify:FL=1
MGNDIRGALRSLNEQRREIYVFALSVLVFGLLLYLLPAPLVEICLLIGILGFAYHIFLTYFEDYTTNLKMSVIPIWVPFFVLSLSLSFMYMMKYNYSIPQIVVFSALLVVFFYFWFIIPAAWYQKHINKSSSGKRSPSSTLSILVPAYNEEEYIGRCLDSLKDSQYPIPKEIIVIDDGSEDNTYDVAQNHATNNVKIIQQSNGGKHSALNAGLEQATGDVIVTVDADSVITETALVQIVADLEADANIGAVAGTVKLLRVQSHVEKLQALEYALGINTFRRAFAVLGFVNVVPGCLGCYRRTALESVGGFDGDTMTEDFDVTIKLLKSGWNVQASDALVYTDAPRTWRTLYRQRIRWNWGNIETLTKHRDLLWDKRVNNLTGILIPYQIISLFVMPFATIVILWTIISQLAMGNILYVATMLSIFTLLQMIASLFALVLDENDVLLCIYAPLVVVVYKHIIDAIIIKSLLDILLQKDLKWTQSRDHSPDNSKTPDSTRNKTNTSTIDMEAEND